MLQHSTTKVMLRGLVAIVALVALGQCVLRLWYLLQIDSFTPLDGPVYFAMGRGLLNGLTPYVDLFEVKPPGVFFLSAGSLALFGSPLLGNLLAVILLITLPLLTIVSLGRSTPWLLRAMAGIGMLLLLLYASMQAGMWQAEIFGAPLALLAVLCQYRAARRAVHPLLFSLLAGICAASSIGFKEPFLLPIIASGFLLARTPRDAIFTLAIPLAIAAIIGTALMAVFGYVGPYLSLYLPALLGHHLTDLTAVPLWQRGLNLPLLAARLISGSPLLPLTLASWIVAPLILRSDAGGQRGAWKFWILCVLFTLPSVILVRLVQKNFAELFPIIKLTLSSLQLPDMGLLSTLLVIADGTALLSFILLLMLLRILWKHPSFPRLLVWIAALELTVLATGLGGGLPHQHYVFAIPTYGAILLLCIESLRARWTLPTVRIVAASLTFLSLLAIALLQQPGLGGMRAILEARSHDRSIHARKAAMLDRLLDTCSIDRYFLIDTARQPLIAYTVHSPLNFYMFRDPWEESGYGPSFANHARSRLAEAQILVGGPDILAQRKKDDLTAYIDAHFTAQTPPCARNLPLPENVLLLWRRS